MNVIAWIVKELAALREAVERLHEHNQLPPPAPAASVPAHLAPVVTLETAMTSGQPARLVSLQGAVIFDPSPYPTPAARIAALHELQGLHPLGTRIVDPSGNEIDVRGNPIVSSGPAPDFRGSVLPWDQQGIYRAQPGKAGEATVFTFDAPAEAHVQLLLPFGPHTGDAVTHIDAQLDDGPVQDLLVNTQGAVAYTGAVPAGHHVLRLTPNADVPELRVVIDHS